MCFMLCEMFINVRDGNNDYQYYITDLFCCLAHILQKMIVETFQHIDSIFIDCFSYNKTHKQQEHTAGLRRRQETFFVLKNLTTSYSGKLWHIKKAVFIVSWGQWLVCARVCLWMLLTMMNLYYIIEIIIQGLITVHSVFINMKFVIEIFKYFQ